MKHKKRKRCDSCGEREPLRSVSVHVDGRHRLKQDLCRMCTAILLVRVSNLQDQRN